MIAARSQMPWRLIYVFTMIMSKYERLIMYQTIESSLFPRPCHLAFALKARWRCNSLTIALHTT